MQGHYAVLMFGEHVKKLSGPIFEDKFFKILPNWSHQLTQKAAALPIYVLDWCCWSRVSQWEL